MNATRVGWFGDRAVSPRPPIEAVPFDPRHLIDHQPRRPHGAPPVDLSSLLRSLRP